MSEDPDQGARATNRRAPAPTKPEPTNAAVILPWERPSPSVGTRVAEARLAEAVGLAESIGVSIRYTAIFPLRSTRPAMLLGSGQVEIAHTAITENNIGVAIVDATLSPVQQRNLERAWGCKVIDRTGLILEIFGERAQTREGTLQVELAHLEYQRTRLVRAWTHLERQRGGFGFMGGPGESQIEIDRRLIDDRIIRLKKDLDQVRRTRGLHRSARSKVPYPIVALVGYTNAGKSTLFNAITGAGVYAQDQLFATLDPTMRGLKLPSGRNVIMSDTVGFISSLPTELVAAFRATLEEVAQADLILHVRDAAHPDTAAQREDVLAVLDSLARDGTLDAQWRNRTLEVMNKADLLGGIAEVPVRSEGSIAVSALSGEGLDALKAAIDTAIAAGLEVVEYTLDHGDGARIAWLHEHAEVLEQRNEETGLYMRVRISSANRARFERVS